MKTRVKITALSVLLGLSVVATAQAADRIAFIPKLVGGFGRSNADFDGIKLFFHASSLQQIK